MGRQEQVVKQRGACKKLAGDWQWLHVHDTHDITSPAALDDSHCRASSHVQRLCKGYRLMSLTLLLGRTTVCLTSR